MQKNINGIAFFAPEKFSEKEMIAPLDDERNEPIACM